MKKEEILEKSRKDNKNKDMYAIEVENKGVKIAALSMLCLATFYYCYEIITDRGENYAAYSIVSLYCTILYGYKAAKLESRRSLHIFCAIAWGLVTILTLIGYFK